MGRYLRFILQRILESIFTLFLLLTAIFVLVRLIPGGPFDKETSSISAVQSNLQSQFALDQSVWAQYRVFIANLVRGDLGVSFVQADRTVISLIGEKLAVTAQFAFAALIFSVLLSFWVSAIYFKFSRAQKSIDLFFIAMFSLPTVLAAPFLIYIFSIKLNIVPSIYDNQFASYLLPILILSIRPIASLSQIIIKSIQKNLPMDYVKTVKAYGFSNRSILYKWIFKNTFISWITFLVPIVSGLFSGSLLVEKVFSIPGLGSYYIDSLLSRDYSSLIGITFYMGALVVGCYLIVDLLILILDRRIEKI